MKKIQDLFSQVDRILVLHSSDEEGISSGAPTPEQWQEATDELYALNIEAKEEYNVLVEDLSHYKASRESWVKRSKRIMEGYEKTSGDLHICIKFIDELTNALGKYQYLDGTQVVSDAYSVLERVRGDSDAR